MTDATEIVVEHSTQPDIVVEHDDRTVVVQEADQPREISIGAPVTVRAFAANVGGEAEVFRDKVGTTFNFRTLEGIGGITAAVNGDVIQIDGSGVSQPPGGLDTQLQFNDSGAFGGADLYWIAGTGMLGFGGATSAFPALKRDSAELHLRRADDSTYATLRCNNAIGIGSFEVGPTREFFWSSRSRMSSSFDGEILLTDSGGSNFGLLQFGGITAAYPAWQRNGANFEAQVADGSAYCNVTALDFNLSVGGSLSTHASRHAGAGGDAITSLGAVTMTGAVAMGGFRITGLGTGIAGTDAVTLAQLNAGLDGLKWKDPARAVEIASDITLSGLQTIDTVNLVDGDRALLLAQSTGSEIGLWIVRVGAWERPADFDTGDSAANAALWVSEGSAKPDSRWVCTTDPPNDVIDTDALAFSQFGGLGTGDLQSAYNLSPAAEIVLDVTRGGLTLRDASAPIGANLLEVQDNAGTTTYLATDATGTTLEAAAVFGWALLSSITSLVDGNILLTDNAGTDFGLLQLGGTSNLFPALKRVQTGVHFRNAADTGYVLTHATAVGFQHELFVLGSKSIISGDTADGNLIFTNDDFSDWGLLIFGDEGAAWPAIKRVGAGIDIVLADDSARGALASQTLDLGPIGRRVFEYSHDATGKPGSSYLPDGATMTTTTGTGFALQWASTVTLDIPGGAPFNNSAPAMISATGTAVFAQPGNAFSSSLLFNQGTKIQAQANVGPIYTMINQPQIFADGGSFTCSQHNALRIQPRWGPNLSGGSITQASAVYILNLATVDATVGSAAVTTLTYWQANNPQLVAGATIGTFVGIDFANITTPSTITGIQSAMNNGFFINHTGTAPVRSGGILNLTSSSATIQFGSDVTLSRVAINTLALASGDSLQLPTDGRLQWGTGADILMSRPSVGVLRIQDTEALELNFGIATTNAIQFSSSTGAGLVMGSGTLVFGSDPVIDPTTGNWQALFNPPALTVTLGGDFARRLFSPTGQLEIDAAMSNLFTDVVNEPSINAGASGGSAVNAGNVLIQTSVGFGTNRYGLLVTTNPTGGTVNYCARFAGAAGVRIDGELHTAGHWIDSDYDEAAGQTTVSATLEDITGLTFDLTVPAGQTATIRAAMSIESSGVGANVTGAWAIEINSVDGTEIARTMTTAAESGSVSVQAEQTTLTAGAYTVQGRHRRVAGATTVNTDVAQLSAYAVLE